jgi:hypothetical protein
MGTRATMVKTATTAIMMAVMAMTSGVAFLMIKPPETYAS